MKKLLAICVLLAIIACMSVAVSAVGESSPKVVVSPSGMDIPQILEFDPEDHNCDASAAIASYAQIDSMPEEHAEIFRKAYKSIMSAGNLTELNAGLAKLAKELGLHDEDLYISDFFDIYPIGCKDHDIHKTFHLVLKTEVLKGYVCLMTMDEDGWEIVENAKVSQDGTILSFTIEELGPLAIVVNVNTPAPPTGDNSAIYIYLIIMAVCAIAIVAIMIKSKKQKA